MITTKRLQSLIFFNMKLFLKKVLLYATITIVLLFLCSVDSLGENGWLFSGILIVAALIVTCKLYITKEDWDRIF